MRNSVSQNTVSVTEAVLKGAAAGLIGGAALMLTERLEHAVLLPRGEATAPMGEQAAESIAKADGVALSKPSSQIAGAAGQLAYCALVGAIAGVVKRNVGGPSLVEALATAGLAYAGSMSAGGLLPQLGATAPPSGHSMEETAVPVGAYLAFGLTTAAVLQAI